MATEHNPRQIFERLFGTGTPGNRVENLQRRREEQRSILDYVMEDARAMQRRIAAHDKRKLDEYLTGVRALEAQIQRAEAMGDPRDPGIDTPVGVPQGHEDYVEMMFELMALAFESDSTRVISLMMGHDGDNRSYDFLGISEGHHDLTHHQDQEDRVAKVQRIDQWYAGQFAKLIRRLDSVQDSDGTSVLHNSMIMFGSGNADGNRHTHTDLPILLAGSGGGHLQPGRCNDYDGVPLANLYIRMTQNLGISDVTEFGDSNGTLGDV